MRRCSWSICQIQGGPGSERKCWDIQSLRICNPQRCLLAGLQNVCLFRPYVLKHGTIFVFLAYINRAARTEYSYSEDLNLRNSPYFLSYSLQFLGPFFGLLFWIYFLTDLSCCQHKRNLHGFCLAVYKALLGFFSFKTIQRPALPHDVQYLMFSNKLMKSNPVHEVFQHSCTLLTNLPFYLYIFF